MGLFKRNDEKKKREAEERDRIVKECFDNQCFKEYEVLRQHATTEELIDLWLSKFEKYKAWRWLNPRANPYDFYKRSDAPSPESIKGLLDLFQYVHDTCRDYAEEKERLDKIFHMKG